MSLRLVGLDQYVRLDRVRAQAITLGFIELQCMVDLSLIRTHFSSVGNVDALKDMPLTFLNLAYTNLGGRSGYQRFLFLFLSLPV